MRIVCLSNSFKEGGRCIAGIEIDKDFKIPHENGHPIWIRPVCNTPHEEVPNQISKNFNYYDVLEFNPDLGYKRDDYQSENKLIKNNAIDFVIKCNIEEEVIDKLCNKPTEFPYIFCDTKNSVSKSNIKKLNHSLMMIKTTSFEPIINNSYGKQQIRLIFKYNDQTYNLPITDPLFLRQYKHDNTILNDSHKIYIILSLGVEFNSNFYKLVATIFYDL